MTAIALGLTLLILAATVPIISSLSRRTLAQASLIDLLNANAALADDNLAEQAKLVASLKMSIECLRLTVYDQVEIIGELQDRNACLEQVQKRNMYKAIMAMPVVRWVDPEGEVRQISMN